jgi:hypothetical protein
MKYFMLPYEVPQPVRITTTTTTRNDPLCPREKKWEKKSSIAKTTRKILNSITGYLLDSIFLQSFGLRCLLSTRKREMYLEFRAMKYHC